MRLLARCGALMIVLIAAGCASSAAKQPATSASVAVRGDASPAAQLADMARRETAAPRSLRPANTVVVPAPPGVESDALTRRDPSNAMAFMTEPEALAEVARRAAASAPTAPQPVADERRSEALAHYAKARSAALDGRLLQAVIELQKANELDPASAEVLRELARCYLGVNNTTKAIDTFDQLLTLEPDNADALFAVGIASVGRRDFERGAAMLAHWRALPRGADVNAGSAIIADFALATALREMEYDRAFIAVARQSVNISDAALEQDAGMRLASVYRQRGETWRSIGDAHCRLGEFIEALQAYSESASLPTADPAATLPRVIFANLSLVRPAGAQRSLLDALAGDSPPTGDRVVALCAYLKDHAAPVDILALAVEELQRTRPNDSSLARAAAALLPAERARDLLRAFVADQPRDLDGVQQLLTWVANDDAARAADLAVAMAAANPDLADAYADRLTLAVASGSEALRAVRRVAPSAARSHMEARLLWKQGALGEAWSVIDDARRQWPDDRALAIQQLHLAATLPHVELFEQALASLPPMDDVAGMLAKSQGFRALGKVQEALNLAKQAADLDPTSADAVIERSRTNLAVAASLASDPEARADAVASLEASISDAEQARQMAPDRDDAYEVLAMIYMPGGVRADTESFRTLIQQLRQDFPESPLLARLAAQDDLSQRRFDRAVERLLALYERHPLDGAVLGLAVAAWQQSRRLDEAQAWLEGRLADRPGDAAALEQWVRVQLMRDQAAAAVARLEAIANSDPDNYLARRLLEMAYRGAGNIDAATSLGERRLLALPDGVRREIDLAALYAAAKRNGDALLRLDWIRDHADRASLDELIAALHVVARLEGDDSRRDALHLELANLAIDRHPDAPLAVYGFVLRAMANAGTLNEQFDAVAERAVAQAKGADGQFVPTANLWRDLAQSLVDDGNPEAASRAIRARLRADAPLEDGSRGMVTVIALVADAAADAQEHDPRHAERSSALLNSLNEQGKIDVIFREQERASFATALYEASAFYTLVGARRGAALLLRQSLAIDPEIAMAMNNLGYSLLDTAADAPSREEAEHLIERAFAIMPEDPNILDSLGWLRYKQGHYDDTAAAEGGGVQPGALTLIQKSITRALSPSPEVIDHRGDVQWRLGREREAAESWREAVRLVEDEQFRSWVTENLRTLQSAGWQLIVIEPGTMYDQEYGPILDRAKAKLAAVDAGQPPQVAPLFDDAD